MALPAPAEPIGNNSDRDKEPELGSADIGGDLVHCSEWHRKSVCRQSGNRHMSPAPTLCTKGTTIAPRQFVQTTGQLSNLRFLLATWPAWPTTTGFWKRSS